VVEAAEGGFYFQPQLAVHSSGRLGVSAFLLKDGHVTPVRFVSQPGELLFGPPIRVSDEGFDPKLGQSGGSKHGAWWFGDYQGLAATPEGFVAVWNDARTGALELFSAAVR
jgi:hypothetical protein